MAFSPDERTELLPNNSVPLSICPLSFKSRTKKPSSAPTQPVLSAKPCWQNRIVLTPTIYPIFNDVRLKFTPINCCLNAQIYNDEKLRQA